jgi:hypothetical protein
VLTFLLGLLVGAIACRVFFLLIPALPANRTDQTRLLQETQAAEERIRRLSQTAQAQLLAELGRRRRAQANQPPPAER